MASNCLHVPTLFMSECSISTQKTISCHSCTYYTRVDFFFFLMNRNYEGGNNSENKKPVHAIKLWSRKKNLPDVFKIGTYSNLPTYLYLLQEIRRYRVAIL